MRKFGLQVINLVSLIRHFNFLPGLGIFFNLLFTKENFFIVKSKKFKNNIYLRKDQSDPFIFEQVFVEQQYKFDYGEVNSIKWIIDAGANIGLAAIFFSEKYPDAKIISIEPDKNNFELLKKNTVNYKNVYPVNAALWYQDELLDISNKDEKSAGFMIESATNSNENLIHSVTVSGLMQQYKINEISILKLDIEGSEKEIFQHGSAEWLPHCKVVITELHDWMKAGTSKVFFGEMAKYDWMTYVKGENIICLQKK